MNPDPWSYIRGMQPQSLCDWPGHVSAVLFAGGCNLRCPTCHNSSLAWHPEDHPILGQETVLGHIQSRKAWLDGVVLTGGEPTMVPSLDKLISEIRELGLPCKLDSNGLRPEVLTELIESELVELAAVDVKGPWSKYPELTGGACSAKQAQDNLERVFALAERFPNQLFFRCTKVPALSQQDLQATQDLLPTGMQLTFQDYIPPKPH
jgi:pyruvate formate lyase activating enzyme